MHLIDKFLITGSETIAPRPHTPHASLEKAIEAAKGMISGADYKQDAAIIWVPLKVVRRKQVPVEVVEARELGAHFSVSPDHGIPDRRTQLEQAAAVRPIVFSPPLHTPAPAKNPEDF